MVVVETAGDRQSTTPLQEIGGQGIFVKEVQYALLEGDADLAVHSAKDLPGMTPADLELVAVPERLDPADVLVGRSLAGLGPGATVATGSPRRRALLGSIRPDLRLVELRGNMATRLASPGRDGIDAIVAAMAALIRLGATDLVAERLDPEVVTPQVGQGAIAVEALAGSDAAMLAAAIDDVDEHRCVETERAFLRAAGAGCTVPAGAWCSSVGGSLLIRAVAQGADGALRRAELQGDDPERLGTAIADAVGLLR